MMQQQALIQMRSNMDILKAENIKKSYDGRTIIEGINIHLKEGEIVSLLGVSGGGKTTLFHCLSGLVTPDEGHVYLNSSFANGFCEDAEDHEKWEEITSKPGHISYMLQKDLLMQHKKIVDNVAMPLLLKGMKKAEAREKASSYFETFGLRGTENKYPSQLSGGMRQRAALLRTYLASDGIALLDEPFSALDAITKDAMHSWYLEIMEKIHLSTIFISHDIDEAIKLSDRIYILGGEPGSIIDEIVVSEPKPRGEDFNLTEGFLKYKRRIMDSIKKNQRK